MVIELWTVATVLDICTRPEVIKGALEKVAIAVASKTADDVTDEAVETISQHRL